MKHVEPSRRGGVWWRGEVVLGFLVVTCGAVAAEHMPHHTMAAADFRRQSVAREGLAAAHDLGVDTLKLQRLKAEEYRAEMLRSDSMRAQKLWAKWLMAQAVKADEKRVSDFPVGELFRAESLRGGCGEQPEKLADVSDEDLSPIQEGARDMQDEEVEVQCSNNLLFKGKLYTADESMNVVLKPPIEIWNVDTNTLVDQTNEEVFIKGTEVQTIGQR